MNTTGFFQHFSFYIGPTITYCLKVVFQNPKKPHHKKIKEGGGAEPPPPPHGRNQKALSNRVNVLLSTQPSYGLVHNTHIVHNNHIVQLNCPIMRNIM